MGFKRSRVQIAAPRPTSRARVGPSGSPEGPSRIHASGRGIADAGRQRGQRRRGSSCEAGGPGRELRPLHGIHGNRHGRREYRQQRPVNQVACLTCLIGPLRRELASDDRGVVVHPRPDPRDVDQRLNRRTRLIVGLQSSRQEVHRRPVPATLELVDEPDPEKRHQGAGACHESGVVAIVGILPVAGRVAKIASK